MIDLRELRPEDLETLYRWRRSREVDRWMSGPPPEALDRHRAWFDRFLADEDRGGWIITRNETPCGFLTLVGLRSPHRRVEHNWYVGEDEARGRGVGRAAQALGLEIAFGRYGVAKVYAEVMADNDAALRSQASTGFRREGYLRDHVVKGGERRDVVLLGLLAAEWAAQRAPILGDLARSHLIDAAWVGEAA